jgi:hypothetical protein
MVSVTSRAAALPESTPRAYLRRQLEAHLIGLGYSSVREKRTGDPAPEITRINPLRGRLVYGETVLRGDLQQRRCHDRLLSFSQRRTRHRSSILLFIGVAADDEEALLTLLKTLGICGGLRGGHVHVLPIATAPPARRPRPSRAARG